MILYLYDLKEKKEFRSINSLGKFFLDVVRTLYVVCVCVCMFMH